MNEYYKMMESMLDDYKDFITWEKSSVVKRGIRVNTLKTDLESFETIFNVVHNEPLIKTPFSPFGYSVDNGYGDSIMHRAGLFYMQEPSAMSAVTALAPYIGNKILDMCAAPGGKSTQAASYLNGKGIIVSNEIVFNRAKVLRSNIERCGVRNAMITNNTPESLSASLPNYFDTIIVDAPCSGEGMFLKEPQARDMWSMDYVNECAARQLSILECADKALCVGGVIAYSTCTYNTVENEGVINRFVANHDYEILPIIGLDECTSPSYGIEKARRIFPHRHGGLGHFICVMRKLSGSQGGGYIEFNPYDNYNNSELEHLWSEIAATEMWAKPYRYKESIYLLPDGLPFVKGMNIVTAGVKVAEEIHGRLVPHHAVAMALRRGEAHDPIATEPDGETIARYLRGEVIDGGDRKGYRLVTCGGYPIGLVKISDGAAKNHYPKGLRRIK